jgi:uncharacterized protein YciI
MKNLFVILLKYIAPLDVIDSYRADHLKFLDRYYEKGVFIISGPQNPRTGGVIFARCSDKASLEKICSEDPFALRKLATYEIIEFNPTKSCTSLSQLISAVD